MRKIVSNIELIKSAINCVVYIIKKDFNESEYGEVILPFILNRRLSCLPGEIQPRISPFILNVLSKSGYHGIAHRLEVSNLLYPINNIFQELDLSLSCISHKDMLELYEDLIRGFLPPNQEGEINAYASQDILRLLSDPEWVTNRERILKLSFVLFDGAKENDEKKIKQAILGGVDVNICGAADYTALYFACRDSGRDVISTLLSHGANPNIGTPPLLAASERGDIETVKLLLKHGADPLATGYKGENALVIAINNGHRALANYLSVIFIANCKILNWLDAPFLSSVEQQMPDLMTLFLDYGAPLEVTGKEGKTALHYACRVQSYDIALILITRGSDVNTTDDFGWTALHYACGNLDDKIASLLIAHGANVNITDTRGESALIHALSACYHRSIGDFDDDFGMDVVVEKSTRTVRTLINAGADVNAKSSFSDPSNALAWAKHWKLKHLIDLLSNSDAT